MYILCLLTQKKVGEEESAFSNKQWGLLQARILFLKPDLLPFFYFK